MDRQQSETVPGWSFALGVAIGVIGLIVLLAWCAL